MSTLEEVDRGDIEDDGVSIATSAGEEEDDDHHIVLPNRSATVTVTAASESDGEYGQSRIGDNMKGRKERGHTNDRKERGHANDRKERGHANDRKERGDHPIMGNLHRKDDQRAKDRRKEKLRHEEKLRRNDKPTIEMPRRTDKKGADPTGLKRKRVHEDHAAESKVAFVLIGSAGAPTPLADLNAALRNSIGNSKCPARVEDILRSKDGRNATVYWAWVNTPEYFMPLLDGILVDTRSKPCLSLFVINYSLFIVF